MAAGHDELRELPPPTPAPPELCERAMELVRYCSACFWFQHSQMRVVHLKDVRCLVEHLRENGDHRAWYEAQDLQQCLLALHPERPVT
jgi:hypothetical protein